MKKFSLACMTVACMSVANMSVAQEDRLSTCTVLKDLAENIMDGRQKGVDVTSMLGISDSDLVKALVLHAYSRPQYSTLDYKRESIKEFGLDVFLECMDI